MDRNRTRTAVCVFRLCGLISGLIGGLMGTPTAYAAHPAVAALNLPLGAGGGFSGLVVEEYSASTGVLKLLTHTDHGSYDEIPKGTRKVFVPELVRIEANALTQTASITDRIPIKRPKGDEISGLKAEKWGFDFESIAQDPDGSFWMGDEFWPSLVHLDQAGTILARYQTPSSAYQGDHGVNSLPEKYSRGQTNRGFEGIAVDGDSVCGFMQSPLEDEKRFARIPCISRSTGQFIAEHKYFFDGASENDGSRKLGDAVAAGGGDYYVIEQNGDTGPRAFHRVYRFHWSKDNQAEQGPEYSKELVADLVALGHADIDAWEGLAVADPHTLVLISDNDYGKLNVATRILILTLP